MRINKFLATCGIASRRGCDKLIQEGVVKINNKIATLGDEVDEFKDSVSVNNKKVNLVLKNEYYIMNKPKGYVTTVIDDKGRKTVMDLLPKTSLRLFPVGRLDYDTEGLLLFTNDGDLTFRLTHPKNEIPKTYMAKIDGTITENQLMQLRNGVILDGEKTNKSNVKIIEETKEFTKLTIIINEGKNRQIRKMFEAVDKEVLFLKRIKIGDFSLRGLERGEVRSLNQQEIEYFKNL
jgi:pseudouridine synthase